MAETAKSELAWDLIDYQAHGEEPPARIRNLPHACEGELMSDEEVEQYLKDGIATVVILRDKGSERTAKVHQTFLADCKFLVSIGRLDADEYNELEDLENYGF